MRRRTENAIATEILAGSQPCHEKTAVGAVVVRKSGIKENATSIEDDTVISPAAAAAAATPLGKVAHSINVNHIATGSASPTTPVKGAGIVRRKLNDVGGGAKKTTRDR